MIYNQRVHSSTGESPNKRFLEAVKETTRRIKDLQWFEALYLMRETRTITKYGKVKLFSNHYPVKNIPHGTVVELRFNPFDLSQIYVYHQGKLIQSTSPSKIVTHSAPYIPEEARKKDSQISEESRIYFTRLREQYKKSLADETGYIPYSKLKETEEKENE